MRYDHVQDNYLPCHLQRANLTPLPPTKGANYLPCHLQSANFTPLPPTKCKFISLATYKVQIYLPCHLQSVQIVLYYRNTQWGNTYYSCWNMYKCMYIYKFSEISGSKYLGYRCLIIVSWWSTINSTTFWMVSDTSVWSY